MSFEASQWFCSIYDNAQPLDISNYSRGTKSAPFVDNIRPLKTIRRIFQRINRLE